MKKIYEKIVIVKIEILENEVDPTHHQTSMHVYKEMTLKEYETLIDTWNFLDRVRNLIKAKEFKKE